MGLFSKKSEILKSLEAEQKKLFSKDFTDEIGCQAYALGGAIETIKFVKKVCKIDLDLTPSSINELYSIIENLSQTPGTDEDFEAMSELAEMFAGYFSIIATRNIDELTWELDNENYLPNSIRSTKLEESYEITGVIFHQLANPEHLVDVKQYYKMLENYERDTFEY